MTERQLIAVRPRIQGDPGRHPTVGGGVRLEIGRQLVGEVLGELAGSGLFLNRPVDVERHVREVSRQSFRRCEVDRDLSRAVDTRPLEAHDRESRRGR